MKRSGNEAGVIRYFYIRKNTQGKTVIEVQGKFLPRWIGKRVVLNQIITTAAPPVIMRRIVTENVTSPANVNRRINNILIGGITGISRPAIEYQSEEYQNALIALETAAKAASLGFAVYTDARALNHTFQIYDGLNLTDGNGVYPPCIFSQRFDNILEQDYLNSVENLRTTAYVGGEIRENVPRQIVEVNPQPSGLDRDEIWVSAQDIKQTYRENQQEITIPLAQYLNMLRQRGAEELENYTEVLGFTSKVNTNSKLVYKKDYNLGDRVTCVNKDWGVKINVRITEIAEIYQRNAKAEIEVTFGESLPALFDVIK